MTFISGANTILTLIYLVFTVGTFLGSIVIARVGIAKSANEIQQRVIMALQGEINVLKDEINVLKKENVRLKQTLSLIKKALKSKGLTITIDGDLISIQDEQGSSVHTAHITGDLPPEPHDATVIIEQGNQA